MNDTNQTATDTDSSESSVLNEVRKQLRDANKELEGFRKAKLESDRTALNEAGFGKITPLYEKLVKDDPTVTVDSFLADYGLASTEPVVGEDSAPQEEAKPDDVSGLSQQVAASASGGPTSREAAFSEALAGAKSSSEIDAIMAEYGAG